MPAKSSTVTGQACPTMETSENNASDICSEKSHCLQQVFLVSQAAQPDSEEAQTITVGSGRTLSEFFVKRLPIGRCLRILMESLLLSREWFSSVCFLKWKIKATRSNRLLFQLAPLAQGTDETGSGLFCTLIASDAKGSLGKKRGNGKPKQNLSNQIKLLPTLVAQDSHGHQYQTSKGKITLTLPGVIRLCPTLTARDYKHPGNIERQRSRRKITKYSQPIPVFAGLKLTSDFCEAYMGFPDGWTYIEASESKRSAKRLSLKSPIKSSKP